MFSQILRAQNILVLEGARIERGKLPCSGMPAAKAEPHAPNIGGTGLRMR